MRIGFTQSHHWIHGVCLLIVAGCSPDQSPAAAEDLEPPLRMVKQAGAEARAMGISSYSYECSDSTCTVELVDRDRNVTGLIEATLEADRKLLQVFQGGQEVYLEVQPHRVRIGYGDKTSAEFTSSDTEKTLDENQLSVALRARPYLDLLANTSRDLGEHAVSASWRAPDREPVSEAQAPLSTDSKASAVPEYVCNGRWYRGEGSFTGTQSECCLRAETDVDWKCSNQYCYGCCTRLSCDAACTLGGYLCWTCGIWGQACSAR